MSRSCTLPWFRFSRWLGPMILGGLVMTSSLFGQPPTRTTTGAQQDTAPLIVKRHSDKRTLLRGDLMSDRVTTLYRSSRDVISTIRVSPGGRFTAAIETQVDEDYSTLPSNQLVILDARGQVAHRVERDVQTYVFSPDGRKLAYVVGRWYEGGVGFLPEGLFVLDLETWQETAIPDVVSPYELNWLQTDEEDAIFSRTLGDRPTARVTRYDLRRQRAQAEPNGAFHLSPDGRFYLKRADELLAEGRCSERSGLCIEVYERSSGRAVPLPEALEGDDPRGVEVDWVYGRSHLLLVSRRDEEREMVRERRGFRTIDAQRIRQVRRVDNAVVDVATGRTVERPTGLPLLSSSRRGAEEWTTGRDRLLLRPLSSEAETSTPGETLRQRFEVRTLDAQRLESRRLDPRRLRAVTPPPPTRRPTARPSDEGRRGGGRSET